MYTRFHSARGPGRSPTLLRATTGHLFSGFVGQYFRTGPFAFLKQTSLCFLARSQVCIPSPRPSSGTFRLPGKEPHLPRQSPLPRACTLPVLDVSHKSNHILWGLSCLVLSLGGVCSGSVTGQRVWAPPRCCPRVRVRVRVRTLGLFPSLAILNPAAGTVVHVTSGQTPSSGSAGLQGKRTFDLVRNGHSASPPATAKRSSCRASWRARRDEEPPSAPSGSHSATSPGSRLPVISVTVPDGCSWNESAPQRTCFS